MKMSQVLVFQNQESNQSQNHLNFQTIAYTILMLVDVNQNLTRTDLQVMQEMKMKIVIQLIQNVHLDFGEQMKMSQVLVFQNQESNQSQNHLNFQTIAYTILMLVDVNQNLARTALQVMQEMKMKIVIQLIQNVHLDFGEQMKMSQVLVFQNHKRN